MPKPTITPEQFVDKWRNTRLTERASYTPHFLDVCRLIGIEPPDGTGKDADGLAFQFEYGVKKANNERQGFADVYYENHFAIEYKAPSRHKTLTEAYNQLKKYRQNLENPPLLIVTDINTWEIHTNFTNAAHKVYKFNHADIAMTGENVITGERTSRPLDILRKIFTDPNALHPDRTTEQVTREAATTFRVITDEMRKNLGADVAPERIAHFLTKIVFTLFAEDVGLLPVTTSGKGLFTEIIDETYTRSENFAYDLHELFDGMAEGKRALRHDIRYFNGRLFEDIEVEPLSFEALQALRDAARLDWSAVEPSIFGTLFERSLDPSKRSQLGAHYTSPDDINLVIEPVLMQPLREQWESLRTDAELARQAYESAASRKKQSAARDELEAIRAEMLKRLRSITVLDPACGSGNFLYMSLRALLDMEKAVITDPLFVGIGLTDPAPEVHPRQMYGIEINPIAHDLATIVVWIGWIQWKLNNGYTNYPEPVLQDLGDNIQQMDAILDFDADGNPIEPTWPAVDVIVGNPPFLGSQRMRGELGNDYLDTLHTLYTEKIAGSADLVCYWFERARAQLVQGYVQRVGLLATNSIRGGSNREVLKRIKDTGDIFMAWSDNPWLLDGAAVRVSIVGFDNGTQNKRHLDGIPVEVIHSDLTAKVDITIAKTLTVNLNLAFQGPVKVGPFDIPNQTAQNLLADDPKNEQVIRPYMNGQDIVKRSRGYWIIDFDEFDQAQAAQYKKPFAYVQKHVKPLRMKNNSVSRRTYWWRLGASGKAYRNHVDPLKRQIFTPRVAKHRVFIWVASEYMPSDALVAIARDDDYFFGVLHSRLHEVWSLRMGTWLGKGNDPRYTPTTTFETFPFPWSPGAEDTSHPAHARISAAARQLHTERDAWLNPSDDAIKSGSRLKDRTLTHLYNALAVYRGGPGNGTKRDAADFAPRLDELHRELDEAVCEAYGWPLDTLKDDEAILRRLLALNLERAGESAR